MVVGNPITSISSGKFLVKFLKILTPISNRIFVINDGFPQRVDNKVHIINATAMLKRFLVGRNKSFLARYVIFALAQLASTFVILKHYRNVDLVIVLPTTAVLPVLTSKLMQKRVFLMAAQKITTPIKDNSLRESLTSSLIQALKGLAFFFSDKIIVESKNVINALGLRIWINKTIIAPIYVDLTVYTQKRSLKDRKNVVGYIGNLVRRKGIEEFAKSMPRILEERQNVAFIIGGTGPALNSLKGIISDYRLSHKVTFRGFIPEKDLPKCLNALKLLVLPSYSEGLPNIVLESMACGTPVLATPVGGIPDVIEDGETGIILRGNSAESIVRGVIGALDHPKLPEIANKARALVKSKYSYEVAVNRYKNILTSLR